MVAERLGKYIDFKGISYYAFENALRVSRGSISKAVKENKSIGSAVLENILILYDDLNPEWLMTGRGEMIKRKGVNGIKTDIVKQDVSDSIFREIIREKDTRIEVLSKDIGRLEEKNEELKKLIRSQEQGARDAGCAAVG